MDGSYFIGWALGMIAIYFGGERADVLILIAQSAVNLQVIRWLGIVPHFQPNITQKVDKDTDFTTSYVWHYIDMNTNSCVMEAIFA